MKKAEEVMEILEAFDLTGSLSGAAELCGCGHGQVVCSGVTVLALVGRDVAAHAVGSVLALGWLRP